MAPPAASPLHVSWRNLENCNNNVVCDMQTPEPKMIRHCVFVKIMMEIFYLVADNLWTPWQRFGVHLQNTSATWTNYFHNLIFVFVFICYHLNLSLQTHLFTWYLFLYYVDFIRRERLSKMSVHHTSFSIYISAKTKVMRWCCHFLFSTLNTLDDSTGR